MLFWHDVDNLFGSCQSRSDADRGWVDGYRYHLNGEQLLELYHIVLRLVADGYTWRHRRTQCLLYATLSRYRHGSIVSNIPTMCVDVHLLEGQFRPDLVNSSHLGLRRVSPNMRSHLSRNYDKAFGRFEKFMQGVEADDLLALKQFLLDDSTYKHPSSVKTVPQPTKPSALPSTEVPGTVF